jgi:hypothetical protein
LAVAEQGSTHLSRHFRGQFMIPLGVNLGDVHLAAEELTTIQRWPDMSSIKQNRGYTANGLMPPLLTSEFGAWVYFLFFGVSLTALGWTFLSAAIVV